MNPPFDQKQFKVLFVDDEQQALKYFCKATDKDYDVITASSVAEAWELVEADADQIGVVVTDQRMPKEQGVELLSRLRQQHPNMVRILTTAYSDLDSAIDAVNSGQIFYYITKPWNVRELRVVLMRAMEFFLLQRERDMLLGEKLSVFQKMLVQDRARGLAVFAASMTGQMRFSLQALRDYVEQAPPEVIDPPANGKHLRDLWGALPQQSLRMLRAIEEAVQSIENRQKGFGPVDDLAGLVQEALGGKAASIEALPKIHADAALLEKAISILSEALGDAPVNVRCEPQKVWGNDGSVLHFVSDGPDWSDQQWAGLFSALKSQNEGDEGVGMLAAFLMAYHHGGRLVVCPKSPAGPGFQLHLPHRPEAAQVPELDGDWLENLFIRIESWA